MKNLKFPPAFALVILLTVSVGGCNRKEEKVADTAKNPDNVAGTVAGTGTVATTEMGVDKMLEGNSMNFEQVAPPAFKAQFKNVVAAYMAMKDAFVEDNAAEVSSQATRMMVALQQMPDAQLSGPALTFWKEKKSFLMEHLKLYKAAEDLTGKRKNFVFLSTVMVKSVQAFGRQGQKLYVDYCPMANHNQGAYWLSQTAAIHNPYLGGKMPNCGEVKKEL
jgi:Cu(I)/Ag(I) efflux system membrane fusion protein